MGPGPIFSWRLAPFSWDDEGHRAEQVDKERLIELLGARLRRSAFGIPSLDAHLGRRGSFGSSSTAKAA